MNPSNILICGGAGYIGSHCVKALSSLYNVVVLDLKTPPLSCHFYQGSIRDKSLVRAILVDNKIDTVIHLAGSISVEESVHNPTAYFQNNVCATVDLIEVMLQCGVYNLIFSSTCAVYDTKCSQFHETFPLKPASPYGVSKQIVEQIIQNTPQLNAIIFRYFNVAGAAKDGSLCERHNPETHLIPCIFNSVLRGAPFTIYGTDYDTDDGTCYRDFVHVEDVAHAHVLALERGWNGCQIYNLGSGKAHSVRRVIKEIESITGRRVDVREAERRDGDVGYLSALIWNAKEELGWVPRNDLTSILGDHWRAIENRDKLFS